MDKKRGRKLEIFLNPHYEDNKYKPYFYCIMEYGEESKNWSNTGKCGWAETIDKAFEEAKEWMRIGGDFECLTN